MTNTPRCPKCGSLNTSTTLENKLKKGYDVVKQIGRTVLLGPLSMMPVLRVESHQSVENEYVCEECGHVWTDSDDRLPTTLKQYKKRVPAPKIGTKNDWKMVLDVLGKIEHREGKVSETSVFKTEPKALKVALQEYGISLSVSKINSVNTYKGMIDLIISEGQHGVLKNHPQSAAQTTKTVPAQKPKSVQKTESFSTTKSVKDIEPKPKVLPDTLQKEKCPIFISYKRLDKDEVFPIVGEIESRLGVKCWVDLDGIESSEVFDFKICKALDAAEVVLFMYSKHHLNVTEEDWTVRELNYAKKKEKRLVLIHLDDTKLDGVFLLRYNNTDNIDIRVPEQKNKLFRDLCRWLDLKDSKVALAAPDSSPEHLYREAMEIFQGPNAKLGSLKAFTRLKKAAEAGFVDAIYELAICYDRGRGIKSDKAKAVAWYKRAADAGHVNALVMLGAHYLSGDNKDEEQAIECFTSAEEQGNPRAKYYLGYCYEKGLGVEEDPELASEWYRKAAEAGDEDAIKKVEKS